MLKALTQEATTKLNLRIDGTSEGAPIPRHPKNSHGTLSRSPRQQPKRQDLGRHPSRLFTSPADHHLIGHHMWVLGPIKETHDVVTSHKVRGDQYFRPRQLEPPRTKCYDSGSSKLLLNIGRKNTPPALGSSTSPCSPSTPTSRSRCCARRTFAGSAGQERAVSVTAR